MCAALNPMSAAAFSGTAGAIAAVFSGAQLLNLGQSSYSSNSQQSQTSTSGITSSSQLANHPIERSEWMSRIENAHIDRNLMNRLVMNYLVTEGFQEAADKFKTETGIYYPYDTESLSERIKIREAIEQGKIEDAIYLLNNLHPELIDTNRVLAFHLQQQQLIELIRDKRLEDALTFAQSHLCEYGENNEQIQEELERTMALLAFDNPLESPFADLLQIVQRQRLASEANAAILSYENQESNAKLNILVRMLLWSQDLLDRRSIFYPRMSDIGNARVEETSQPSNSNL